LYFDAIKLIFEVYFWSVSHFRNKPACFLLLIQMFVLLDCQHCHGTGLLKTDHLLHVEAGREWRKIKVERFNLFSVMFVFAGLRSSWNYGLAYLSPAKCFLDCISGSRINKS